VFIALGLATAMALLVVTLVFSKETSARPAFLPSLPEQ
jgi:hypothetical protein